MTLHPHRAPTASRMYPQPRKEPGIWFHDLPLAMIRGAILATDTGTTPAGMTMVIAYERAPGECATKTMSGIGASKEGEAFGPCALMSNKLTSNWWSQVSLGTSWRGCSHMGSTTDHPMTFDILHGRSDLYGPAALVHHPFPGRFGLPSADDRCGGGGPYGAWRPRLGGLLPSGGRGPHQGPWHSIVPPEPLSGSCPLCGPRAPALIGRWHCVVRPLGCGSPQGGGTPVLGLR